MKQKNLKHLTTLIVACFLLSSLAFMDSAKAQGNTNTWTVTVTDRNNNPISGVMVFLYETETGQLSDGSGYGFTNANGILVFSEMTPPNDGGYTLVEIWQMGAPSGSWSSSWVEVKNADLQGGQPMVTHAYFDSPLPSAPYSVPFKPYVPLTFISTPTPTTFHIFGYQVTIVGLLLISAFVLGVILLIIALASNNKGAKNKKVHR